MDLNLVPPEEDMIAAAIDLNREPVSDHDFGNTFLLVFHLSGNHIVGVLGDAHFDFFIFLR